MILRFDNFRHAAAREAVPELEEVTA